MSKQKPKINTMEEFAEVSGLSRPTLSKYFNDADSVRKTTRSKIEAALKAYDYRPNIFAINQNRKLTKTIGIVVPYLADPVFAEIARAVERRCISAGYRTSLFSSHGETKYEAEALESLRSLRPSGVILAPLGRISDSEAIASFCDEVPTVLLDRDVDGVGEAFVGSDNSSFVKQSVEYMTQTGEAPCFFEMKDPANPNSIARRRTYEAAMKSSGLEPMFVQVEGRGWDMERLGYDGAMKIISERKIPASSVLCSNDRLAIGFLAACYEKGLRVGLGEGCALRVAGHDDHPYARFTSPALTTVAHEYDSVSSLGVETLFELIENGGRFESRKETLLPARLVRRLSA